MTKKIKIAGSTVVVSISNGVLHLHCIIPQSIVDVQMTVERVEDLVVLVDIVDVASTINKDDSRLNIQIEEMLSLCVITDKKKMKIIRHTHDCLFVAGLLYLGDIVVKSERELLKLPNFRNSTVAMLKEFLAIHQLKLNMEVKLEREEHTE